MILFIIILLLSFACTKPAEKQEEKITVVASIYPLADWVKNVGGEQVEVICLLPPGASPHAYEPTPKIVRQLAKARIFFKIGRGLDDWGDKIVATAAQQEVKIITLSTGMPEFPALESAPDNETHYHAASADPHIWLNPLWAQSMVLYIADELGKISPAADDYFHTNAENYMRKLVELHLWIEKELANLSQREFIAFHSSFTYFAPRYNMKQVAVIQLSPGKEPTMAHIARLINILKGMKRKVIFAEPQLSDKSAYALAKEVGAPVAYLDPLGDPNVPERQDYLSLMKYNVQQFKKYLE